MLYLSSALLIVLGSIDASNAAPCSSVAPSYQAPYDLSLSPLLSGPSTVFADSQGKPGTYYIQPCGSVPDSLCPYTQSPGLSQQCFQIITFELVGDGLGSPQNAQWSPLNGDWKQGAVSLNTDIAADYDQCNADPKTNSMQINYVCEQGSNTVTAIKEPTPDKNGVCVFELKVDSAIVCAYFIGGIVFNRCVRGQGGVNMIPHVEFWRNLPGLVKEGIGYVVAKCGRLCGMRSTGSGSGYSDI